MNIEDIEETPKPKAMSKTELAQAYGVSIKTFRKWLKPFGAEIGLDENQILTPKQVAAVYDKLGYP